MGQLSPDAQRPTRVRYAVLAVFCSLAFLTYLDRICIMRVQQDVARDLGLNRLTPEDEEKLRIEGKADDPKARQALESKRADWPMSLIFGAFTCGYLLFEIPGGRLGDRWGPRRVLFRIVLCWSFFTALTGSIDGLVRVIIAEPGPWLLVAAMMIVRFLFGAGEAGAYPNISRVIGRWFPYRDRGFASGFIWMSSRLGGALAPTIIGTLMLIGGWRFGFWALGLIGVVWAVVFYWWFRDRPEDMPAVNPAEATLIRSDAAAGASIHDDRHGKVPWRNLLSSVNLWALYVCHACVCFSAYFFITFIPKFLKDRFGVSFEDSQLTSGLPLLVGGVACLIGGRFSDRLIRATGSRRWGRSLIGFGGLAMAGVLMSLVPMASHWQMGVLLLCLVSFSQDLMVPVMWSLPADIGGRHAGTVGGAMNMAGGAGAVIGPMVAAHVSGVYNWNVVFLLFAASYLIAALLWLRIDASEPFEKPLAG